MSKNTHNHTQKFTYNCFPSCGPIGGSCVTSSGLCFGGPQPLLDMVCVCVPFILRRSDHRWERSAIVYLGSFIKSMQSCVCGMCVRSWASAGALRARTVCRYVPDTCASSHVGARVRVSSCVRQHCSPLSSNRGSMLKPSVCPEIVREGEDVSWYCRFSQIPPATAHY